MLIWNCIFDIEPISGCQTWSQSFEYIYETNSFKNENKLIELLTHFVQLIIDLLNEQNTSKKKHTSYYLPSLVIAGSVDRFSDLSLGKSVMFQHY